MEIWKFNDPDPFRPFLRVLENNAPHLLVSAKGLADPNYETSRQDLVFLAKGLVDICPEVRQAVTVLIFSPPVEKELPHFRRLIQWFPDWLPPRWYEYRSLRHLVAELVTCANKPQNHRVLATLLEMALMRSLPTWRQEAGLLFAPLDIVSRRQVLAMVARRLPRPLEIGLRKRLLAKDTLSLGQICEALVAANHRSPLGSLRHWARISSLADIADLSKVRTRGKSMKKLSNKGDKDLRLNSWGQRSGEEIVFLEKLISYQAKELSSVFRLAMETSKRTRKVVLTLHNASLGTASGWGAPPFTWQVPAETGARFSQEVQYLRRNLLKKLSGGGRSSPSIPNRTLKEQADNLFYLWSKRLVRPQILQDLWSLRVSLLLNGFPLDEWEQFLSQGEELLDFDDHHRLTHETGFAITFDPPAIARQQMHQTLLWYQRKKKNHLRQLSLLWALIKTGQDWLNSGRLEYLVLPIIDKFFISSKRDQDLDYLPLFVKLMCASKYTPLFLLIDDTSRASHPSLQLAIDHWREHFGFLGLGVFASEKVPASSVLETILAHSAKFDLFALRPLTEVHNPISFDALLARRPTDFLSPEKYDSSWKDNLPFLYHGTQAAAFSGRVEQSERFSPALITSAGPMAFGTYYRCKLRRIALGQLGFSAKKSRVNDTQSPLEILWSEYAQLTNLL